MNLSYSCWIKVRRREVRKGEENFNLISCDIGWRKVSFRHFFLGTFFDLFLLPIINYFGICSFNIKEEKQKYFALPQILIDILEQFE